MVGHNLSKLIILIVNTFISILTNPNGKYTLSTCVQPTTHPLPNSAHTELFSFVTHLRSFCWCLQCLSGFSDLLLTHNVYKFKLHNMMIWYTYILWKPYYHNKVGWYFPLLIIMILCICVFVCMVIVFKIYSQFEYKMK